jgi:hypothetical protein
MAVLSLKFKVATSFLTSLVAGFLAGQRDDGRDRVRRRAAAAVAGILGLFVGFAFAERLKATESGERVDRLEE